WGERYQPIFTVWNAYKPEEVETGIKVFLEIGGLKYLNYLQGIEEKKEAVQEEEAEKNGEETQGTGEPW
ncbi:MAG TPA: hypothetical protein PLV43_06565, partial [Aequorivita sp.]|nr:hypothetical protein [Aequorivita sp.]